MGGTGQLVRGMAGLIRAQGNTSCAATPKSPRSSVEQGTATGVRLADGETLRADLVVSNADASFTYTPPHRPRTPPPLDRPQDRARAAIRWAWLSGILAPTAAGTTLQHHTILLGPRYKRAPRRHLQEAINLAEDFSLYLHRPTATDHQPGAAGLRRVLRAVTGTEPARAAPIGPCKPNRTAPRSRPNSSAPCFPASATRSSPRRS